MTTNFYHIGSRYRKKENFLLYLILLREKKFYKKIAKSLEGWGGGGGHQKKVTFRSNKSQNRSGQSRNLWKAST